MLLGICLLSTLTSAGEKAIAFTPGEIDFLFPGPFARRSLLLYKLGKSTIAALLTALVMSLALRRNSTLWINCYLGVFLALLFIQYLSTALLLLGQTATEQAWSRGRKIALAIVVGMVLLGLRGVVGLRPISGARSIDMPAIMEQFSFSAAGRILLAPFRPFGEIITAESAPGACKVDLHCCGAECRAAGAGGSA